MKKNNLKNLKINPKSLFRLIKKNKIKEILQVPEEKTGSSSSSEEYILKQIKKQ